MQTVEKQVDTVDNFSLMRSVCVAATFIIVAGFSFVFMSPEAHATDYVPLSNAIAPDGTLAPALTQSGLGIGQGYFQESSLWSGDYPDGVELSEGGECDLPIYSILTSGCSGDPSPDTATPGDFYVVYYSPYLGYYFYLPFHWDDGVFTMLPSTVRTAILSVVPVSGSYVSSSSPVTIAADVYVAPADYVDGMQLKIIFSSNTVVSGGGDALQAWNTAWGIGSTEPQPLIVFPLSIGDNSLSTTTSDLVVQGDVTATYSLVSPSYWSSIPIMGGYFSPDVIDATSSTFIVGEPSQIDIFAGEVKALGNTALFGTSTGGISSTTLASVQSSCAFWDPVTVNLFGCLKGLFLPDQQSLGGLYGQLQSGIMVYFPFGYVTRFVKIINSTSTTPLPSLSVTIPNGFPSAGNTLNLTPWGHLMGPGSYLATATSTQTGMTFEATFEPYWDFFVYFVFGLGIILRLLALNDTLSVPTSGSGRGGKGGGRDKYGKTREDRMYESTITDFNNGRYQ